jgi:hypothetical protein
MTEPDGRASSPVLSHLEVQLTASLLDDQDDDDQDDDDQDDDDQDDDDQDDDDQDDDDQDELE